VITSAGNRKPANADRDTGSGRRRDESLTGPSGPIHNRRTQQSPLENNLAAIPVGPASWTMVYGAHAAALHPTQVVFRPTDPELVLPTELAVPENATSRTVAPLLRAFAAAANVDRQ
jgi:hypothetical protein